MLHACIAINGTATKCYPTLGDKAGFTKLLRNYYSVLGPMGAPGIDITNTRFPVQVKRATTQDGQPDIADVIYGIHRCTHAHGDELPQGFELIADAAGPSRLTRMVVTDGTMCLSDRIVFGLLAVAVLAPENGSQKVPDGYYLSFGASVKLTINDWWGHVDDFPAIVATDPVPLVKLDFDDWMA